MVEPFPRSERADQLLNKPLKLMAAGFQSRDSRT